MPYKIIGTNFGECFSVLIFFLFGEKLSLNKFSGVRLLWDEEADRNLKAVELNVNFVNECLRVYLNHVKDFALWNDNGTLE